MISLKNLLDMVATEALEGRVSEEKTCDHRDFLIVVPETTERPLLPYIAPLRYDLIIVARPDGKMDWEEKKLEEENLGDYIKIK